MNKHKTEKPGKLYNEGPWLMITTCSCYWDNHTIWQPECIRWYMYARSEYAGTRYCEPDYYLSQVAATMGWRTAFHGLLGVQHWSSYNCNVHGMSMTSNIQWFARQQHCCQHGMHNPPSAIDALYKALLMVFDIPRSIMIRSTTCVTLKYRLKVVLCKGAAFSACCMLRCKHLLHES